MVNEGYNSYIGKQIKSYTILHKLGNGGFACVYLARNDLNELVAIKLLNPKYNKSEGRQLFLQEAQFLQELKHQQYILPILDYGENENTPYIIVEYTPGGTLRERINNCRPIAIDDALTILMQVGEAIHIAHQHRIVHSDLKPENILFNNKDDVILADFSIAVQLGENEGFFGLPRGTYAYMAPEQFDGMFTKEGDQYSLGCIAYELLTGRHPFECFLPFNPHDRRIMKERHKNAKVLSPHEFNSAIPYHIEQAILRSMAKKSSERHINIAAFIRSLQQPTGLLSQSAYHFTRPLDTPPLYTSASEEILSPINPRDNSGSASIGIEVYERVQLKASYSRALQNSCHWNPPGQTFPKNAHNYKKVGEKPNIHTDDPILESVVSVPEKSRSAPLRNPLETFDLQLPGKLKTLLSPSLKALKLAHCQGRVWDEVIGKDWKYTGIAFDDPGCPLDDPGRSVPKNKPIPIPQYALVHIPAEFFNEDAIFRIFSIFSHWTLIIFSDELGDPDLQLDRRLKKEGKTRQITWDLLRKKHIDELRGKKKLDERKSLIRGYLKLENLPQLLPQHSEKVQSDDIGKPIAFTKRFLRNTPDIRKLIKTSGSANLQEVLVGGSIELGGAPESVASAIILRLNQPPYQPDNTGHTLLGEFLCILLNKADFVSPSDEEAKRISGIIRKYRLGPPSCPCCKL